jgi:NAD-dependent SIR2 family protein deacetylase
VYDAHPANLTMLDNHISDIKLLMAGIRQAIDSHHERTGQPKTIVIIVNGGRPSYGPDVSQCSWKFSRAATVEAHRHGFAVLERE